MLRDFRVGRDDPRYGADLPYLSFTIENRHTAPVPITDSRLEYSAVFVDATGAVRYPSTLASLDALPPEGLLPGSRDARAALRADALDRARSPRPRSSCTTGGGSRTAAELLGTFPLPCRTSRLRQSPGLRPGGHAAWRRVARPRPASPSAAGAARTAGCRRAGSRRRPSGCRAARRPGTRLRAVLAPDPHRHLHARLQAAPTPRRRRRSRAPVSPSVLRSWPALNWSGSTPMPTRFERWMRSNVSATTALTPSSSGPLAAQSRDEPVPYSLPADHDQRDVLLLVVLRGLEDAGHLVVLQEVDRVVALLARHQLVAQPDVAEGAAHHHLVVAAPGAERVEVDRPDAVLDQVAPGRPVDRDRAGRRDVVGRDRVAEHHQHPRAGDVARPGRLRAPGPRSTAAPGRRSSRRRRRTGPTPGSAGSASARRP